MGGLILQLLRAASGFLAGGALVKGVDVSTDGHGHELVTYLAWYGAAAVFIVTTVVFWIVIYKRHAAGGSPEAPDPCGNLLILLRRGANQLAHNLEHFPNWWSAVEDENFKGKLPDGYGPTTHLEAMETLLFMFGQFFSAAWTYQSLCLTHRNQGEVKALVDEVYDALGKQGDLGDLTTDARIGSDQLHVVGERSTTGWGTAEARPIHRSKFKVKLEHHSEAFDPLRTFFRAAGPDTAARSRLQAAEKAVRRVEEWLGDKGYGP